LQKVFSKKVFENNKILEKSILKIQNKILFGIFKIKYYFETTILHITDHVVVLQGPGVQHGQIEISVDDVRCHQWLTKQIAEAALHWKHEPTSVHQVSVAHTSCGKPPVYSCRQPRGSMFLYHRTGQTLSMLGAGVLRSMRQPHSIIIEKASPILRRASGRQ